MQQLYPPAKKLFRENDGCTIKPILNQYEGISYNQNPLDFYIMLARYKFCMRMIEPHHHVYDIGCGPGVGTVLLDKATKNVTGLDVDIDLVLRNRNIYPNIRFEQFDILSGEVPQCDIAVCLDVIEHFQKGDGHKCAANIAKMLNECGFAIIGTPSANSYKFGSKRRELTHLYEYTPDEFRALLSLYFKNVFLFSMTDETVSTTFLPMAWYLIAICTK